MGTTTRTLPPHAIAAGAVMPVLAAISLSHLLNDLIQSLLPALYPVLKANYALSFAQIGLLTPHVPAGRLAVAAGDRPGHRPAGRCPIR